MKKLTSLLLTCAFLLSVPVGAHAMSALDALYGVGDEDTVTRGDFIRAAIQVLNLEDLTVDERKDLPYRRIPKALEKYVRIAAKKNALEAFGYDLFLARDITRGEALRVLVNLTGLDTSKPAVFSDVRVGTPDERAVRVAVDRDWMDPIRSNLFGINRKLLGKDAILALRKASGEAEVQNGDIQTSSPTIRVNLKTNERLMNLPKTQILETIWSVIEREFLFTDQIDTDEAAYKAAEGLVESLGDKYTTFMRPSRAQEFQTQLNGEVTGIGAQVEYVDEILTIVSPIKGSPAEAAGLLPGDQILKVNGEDLAGLSFLEAVDKVRGPQGSTATLTIRRNDFELNIDVKRDIVRVPEDTITWNGDVVVLEIAQFGRVTLEDLRPQMVEVMKKNPRGVVIDLRNNPGGLLTAANEVVSLFVPHGTGYVEVRSRTDDRLATTSGEQVVPDNVPVAVLVNEGSASASEIVAGALQDLDRATIIGSKSFGKGTVQQVLQFNDQSSLKMTIAEWFTPKGNKINGKGVNPDIGVSEVDGRDAPLLKALDILRR